MFYDGPEVVEKIVNNREKNKTKSKEYYKILYTVKKGETLSDIALRFYGVANMFPVISSYNDIKNAHNLSPGNKLIIPIYKDFTIGNLIPSKENSPKK